MNLRKFYFPLLSSIFLLGSTSVLLAMEGDESRKTRSAKRFNRFEKGVEILKDLERSETNQLPSDLTLSSEDYNQALSSLKTMFISPYRNIAPFPPFKNFESASDELEEARLEFAQLWGSKNDDGVKPTESKPSAKKDKTVKHYRKAEKQIKSLESYKKGGLIRVEDLAPKKGRGYVTESELDFAKKGNRTKLDDLHSGFIQTWGPQAKDPKRDPDSLRAKTQTKVLESQKGDGFIPAQQKARKRGDGYVTQEQLWELTKNRHIKELSQGTRPQTTAAMEKSDPCTASILRKVKPGFDVLAIGYVSGLESYPLLSRGAAVIYNNTDAYQLQSIAKYMDPRYDNRVFLSHRKFPEEVKFRSDRFDAVTMYQELQSMKPEEIRASFEEIYRILKPNGKVYITTLTPYSPTVGWNTHQSLLNRAEGNEWPGEIEDRVDLWEKTTGRLGETINAPGLLNYMNPLFPDMLLREATRAGLTVEAVDYFPCAEGQDEKSMEEFKKNGLNHSTYRMGKDGAYLIAKKLLIK